MRTIDRREFLQFAGLASAGIAGAVFSSALTPRVSRAAQTRDGFVFLQMSVPLCKSSSSRHASSRWPRFSWVPSPRR